MSTAIPYNRNAAHEEAVPTGGPVAGTTTALGPGGVWTTGWLDVAAWGTVRVQASVAANGGTAVLDWSIDGAVVSIAGAPQPVLPGVLFNPGAVAVAMQFVRLTYTQGAGASGAIDIELLVAGFGTAGGGGGGGPVAATLQGNEWTRPAPAPASIQGALGNIAVQEEPDQCLRTRSTVLTDEGAHSDDFSGDMTAALPPLARALTGTCTVNAGGLTVTGVGGTAFMTEVKAGDYFCLFPDWNAANPPLVQVLDVVSDTALNLAGVYPGTLGVGGLGIVQDELTLEVGGGYLWRGDYMTHSVAEFYIDDDDQELCAMWRRFGAMHRKASLPVRFAWRGSWDGLNGALKGYAGVGEYNLFAGLPSPSMSGPPVPSPGNPYPAGNTPNEMVIDSLGQAWIVNEDDDTVSVYDTVTKALIGTYATGSDPVALATDSAGQVWIVNNTDGTITVYNIATHALIGTYPTGNNPAAVVVDAIGQVWISNSSDDTVTCYNAVTHVEVGGSPFATGVNPGNMMVDLAGQIWILNGTANTVTVYDVATKALVVTAATGNAPEYIVLDGLGRVWISNYFDATVTVFTAATHALVGTYPTGNGPSQMAADALNQVWIINYSDETVTVYDSATMTLVGTYAATNKPWDIAVDGLGQVWITESADHNCAVVVYNAATKALVAIFLLGNFDDPHMLAVDALNQVWVSLATADAVAVFEPTIVLPTACSGAWFAFEQDEATRSFTINTAASLALDDRHTETMTLPITDSLLAWHTYEIVLHWDFCDFLLDGVRLARVTDHLPRVYEDMGQWIVLAGTGASGGGANELYFDLDWWRCRSLDALDVQEYADEEDQDEGGGGTTGFSLVSESLPFPDPWSVIGAVLPPAVDLDHSMRVRGAVTSDEGAHSDDFTEASPDQDPWDGLYRALTGVCVFSADSATVTGVGTAFMTQVRAGDYVMFATDWDPSAPTPIMIQVAYVVSDTSLMLVSPYLATGGLGTGIVGDYVVVEAGGPFTFAVDLNGHSVAEFDLTRSTGLASLWRRLGAGYRKASLPIRHAFRWCWDGGPGAGTNFYCGVGEYNLFWNLSQDPWIAPGTTPPANSGGAWFAFDQGNDTQFTINVAPTMEQPDDRHTELFTLPNGSTLSDYNTFEIVVYFDHVDFIVTDSTGVVTLLAHVTDHMPNDYVALGKFAVAYRVPANGASGPPLSMLMDWWRTRSFDAMDTMDINEVGETGGGGGPTYGLQASRFYPDPAEVDTTEQIVLKVDPCGSLEIRGPVLTDEGSFDDDFSGAGLSRALTGTSEFTTGLATVVGTGSLYTSEVRDGDYVKFNLDLEPCWMRVLSVTDDTHLTLVAPYPGFGGPSNTASVRNYATTTGAHGGAGTFVVANSVLSITQAADAAEVTGLLRYLDYGPLFMQWYGNLNQRRANQTTYVGFLDAAPASAVRWACFVFDGTSAAVVKCRTGSSAAANDILDTSVTLPGGALTSADHLWEIRQYADKVMFYFDGQLIATNTRHLPVHYGIMQLGAWLVNGAAAGVTILAVNDWRIENADRVDIVASQPRAEKLRAQIQDITPTCPGASVSVGVTTDNSTVIAATLDVGKLYRISIVGADGLCLRCDGVAPLVSNEPWYSGQKFDFIATVATNPVAAIKRTAGSANGVVVITSLDGGAVT